MANPRPHVTLITLNRPERMNAMSFDVMIPFRQALEEISRDNDTRVVVVVVVVVVTGSGAGFCSGRTSRPLANQVLGADLLEVDLLPALADGRAWCGSLSQFLQRRDHRHL